VDVVVFDADIAAASAASSRIDADDSSDAKEEEGTGTLRRDGGNNCSGSWRALASSTMVWNRRIRASSFLVIRPPGLVLGDLLFPPPPRRRPRSFLEFAIFFFAPGDDGTLISL